jgi:cysteine desulfurase
MSFQEKPIYLDNSATTRPSAEAISKMLNFYTEKWGILTQPHKMGQELFQPYLESLRSIYRLIGATDNDTIVMTSSGAEAINHAILSTYQDVSLTDGKNHFITAATEDAPFLMSFNRLNALGAASTFLKPNKQGIIQPKALIEAITPRTALVAISWANGLTGIVQPLSEIAEICKLRGIRLLVDATHVLGKLFFSVNEFPIDFLSFNGDNLHAPKGSGGLYLRNGIKLSPLIAGGIEQAGLRAGALNVPAVVGLGEAAKQMLEARDYFCTEVARLQMQFEKEILKRIPDAQVLFEYEDKIPGILTICFPGIVNEALLFMLNQKEIFASIGGGSQQLLTHYLKTCGFEPKIADCAISFSLSRETTEDELMRAAGILEACIKKLRKTSSHLFQENV